jgi:hypothetical protein
VDGLTGRSVEEREAVETPVPGPDGRPSTPEDGIELGSAGFANTVSRGSGFTFDALRRVLHPLPSVDARPEVIEGKPGNELSYDQLNQTARRTRSEEISELDLDVEIPGADADAKSD